MTISEREMGEMKQRVKQIEHQRRNDRTIINGLDSELNDLRADMERLRARIYATVSSVAVFVTVVAWAMDFIAA
jgi:predicted  nucleic acid-binding Zn-ribbon protein